MYSNLKCLAGKQKRFLTQIETNAKLQFHKWLCVFESTFGETQEEMNSPSLEAYNYQLNKSLAEESQEFKNNNDINFNIVIRAAEF